MTQPTDESAAALPDSPIKSRVRLKWISLLIGLALLFLTPLAFVARCGKSREAARRELERKGVAYSESAFLESAKHSDVETVKLFLAAGMSPDTRDEKGDTVLINAIGANADAVAGVLLNGGANANSRTHNGSTALHLVALTGNSKIGQLLIKNNADVNAKSNIGETPLMIAALRGYEEIAKLLIQEGADVSARDNRGETPLMHAVERNQTEVIEILKSAGAKE